MTFKNYYKIYIESEQITMLEMNLNTQINNINYLVYMEHKDNENGANKGRFESERATLEELRKEIEK